jgi:hypothetical protein
MDSPAVDTDSPAVNDAVIGGGSVHRMDSPAVDDAVVGGGEAVSTSTTPFSPADAAASVAASKTITQPSTPSRSADTQPTAASPTDASRRSSPRRDPRASVLEIRTTVNLRTLADVESGFESGCKQDTSGLPKGPWKSFQDALADIAKHARNLSTDGGGWSVKMQGVKQGNSKGGIKKDIRCSKYLKVAEGGQGLRKSVGRGCECKWKVTLEECIDKNNNGDLCWSYRSANLTHTDHDLAQRTTELMAEGDKFIPTDLEILAEAMHLANISAADIHHTLRRNAEKQNIPITFDYKYIANRFKPTTVEKTMDASNFYDRLEERKKQGLAGSIRLDSAGRLESAFWQVKGSEDHYARALECNVLLFDTTFNTNKYGMKLGCLTTISETGKTIILACSLVQSESIESFLWVFEMFLECFKVRPAVIFTDGDPAMHNAIKQVLPETVHLLCTYHLSLNLHTHFCSLFPPLKKGETGGGGWKKFKSKWWSIALNHERSSCSNFDAEWAELLEMLPAEPENEKAAKRYQDALTWLEGLKKKSPQWAARFTWAFATYCAHSTQRAEVIHSFLKKYLSSNFLLVTLLKSVDDYAEDSEFRSELQTLRRTLVHASQAFAESPIVNWARRHLQPYAVDILIGQVQMMQMYTAQAHPTNTAMYIVSRVTLPDQAPPTELTFTTDEATAFELGVGEHVHTHPTTHNTTRRDCSCQFPTNARLPCVHTMVVWYQLGITNYDSVKDVFGDHWLLHDKDEMQQRVDKLRQYPSVRQSVPDNDNDTDTDWNDMTQYDRHKLLADDYRNIIHAVSHDPQLARALYSYNATLREMVLDRSIIGGRGSGGKGGGRGDGKGRGGGGRGGGGGGRGHSHGGRGHSRSGRGQGQGDGKIGESVGGSGDKIGGDGSPSEVAGTAPPGKDPNWEGMTVDQLTRICNQHQLRVTGRKHDLIARLIKAGVQPVANATGPPVILNPLCKKTRGRPQSKRQESIGKEWGVPRTSGRKRKSR